MTSTARARTVVIIAVTGLTVALGACGSDEPADRSATADTGATDTATSPSATSAAPESSAVPGPEGPFGPGCAAVPAGGEGSFAGMADDPVATAAANNPALSALVQAVRAANLVESFNTQQDITVLAPANTAFEAVPANNLQALLGDTPRLTALLAHHVIQGRLAPDRLAGTHTTLNNDEITIEGSCETFTIAAEQTVGRREPASVVCGNVQTANAIVYIIDRLLEPPAA